MIEVYPGTLIPEVKINEWKLVSNDGCFIHYKMTGTVEGKPWSATIGFEVDGRDAEYEHHSGEDMHWETAMDNWDGLLHAINHNNELIDSMNENTPQ